VLWHEPNRPESERRNFYLFIDEFQNFSTDAFASILAEMRVGFRELSWSEKNRSIGRIFLEHALLVSDVMVTIEFDCRANGRIRLIWKTVSHA
jgi:hypothetical protein